MYLVDTIYLSTILKYVSSRYYLAKPIFYYCLKTLRINTYSFLCGALGPRWGIGGAHAHGGELGGALGPRFPHSRTRIAGQASVSKSMPNACQNDSKTNRKRL